MPSFKPAYLIHGDDHGRISERRSRLRALAESVSGAQGVELLEGENAAPDVAARALNAMTFAIGRRFVIVDGVERWKEKDLAPITDALANLQPETTVAFFAREDGRAKTAKGLHDAVRNAGGDIAAEDGVKPRGLHGAHRNAGGDIAAEDGVKPWDLPKWVIARAHELGLELEPDSARALIQHVGDRQQRLSRELEKLALGAGPGAAIDVSEVEALTASSAQRKAWSLADALLAGDPAGATQVFLSLRQQGERVPGMLYWMGARIRVAHEVAVAIEAGQAAAQIKRGLRMPSRAADRLIADARRAGADRLRAAIEQIADLELASRGGAPGGAGEDTAMLLAIQRIAA